MSASYLQLGLDEIARRAKAANRILEKCTLCPRECKVNRLTPSPFPLPYGERIGEGNKLGFCQSGSEVIISSAGPHHGEEPPISGTKGSGTIFFTNCNLRCVFCQNYQISQQGQGHPVTTEELADIMLSLQNHGATAESRPKREGCHNINLVSPTHFVPQILEALSLAIPKGLTLPIVYNTNGYDSLETLKLLGGIVDIYLPDIKYAEDRYAKEYSGTGPVRDPPERHSQAGRSRGTRLPRAPMDIGTLAMTSLRGSGLPRLSLRATNGSEAISLGTGSAISISNEVNGYVKHNRLALKEMYRQTGNLVMDENGIAQRGLLIRHLVLPNRLSGTFDCLDFIASEISKDAYISLMSQYHPSHQAHKYPLINRRLKQSEYQEVLAYAEKLGLENCYIQELISSNDFLPDFQKENPFETTD